MIDCEKWFTDALRDDQAALSQTGRQRRAAMRRSLEQAVVVRRRRRAVVRSASAALALMLAAVLWWRSGERGALPSPGRPSPELCHIDLRVVGDDPQIVARCRVRPESVPPQTYISDDELLALLAAIGRPAGLIRTRDRLIVTGDVVDRAGE
jgi:hypothetical protein